MSDLDSYKREGEEEEDEIDELQYKHAKDAILFAIDVSDSMLQVRSSPKSKDDGDSAISAALKCAHALMQQRIISNPNDMMGVLLYGTEKTKLMDDDSASDKLAFAHCYLLTDLTVPSAQDVKRLRKLTEGEDDFAEVMIPSTEKAPLHNVFFFVNQIFATQAANFASRRLFLVTDNDEPPETKQLRETASVRAKDLYDLGIIIELFPIARPNGGFDRSKFYQDIVYSGIPSDPGAPAPLTPPTRVSDSGDGISLLNSLLSSIDSKVVPKRALFSNLPLELGPGLRISVKGYVIFKRQEIHKTSYMYIEGKTAKLAKSVAARLEDDGGKHVEKAKVLKGYKFGGTHITFSAEEMASLRSFGEPVIRILGFKKLSPSALPIWANTNRATFLHPSEEEFVGSARVFAALHAKLLADDKMGVAWFVARKNAAPVLAAVLAGEEQQGDSDEQTVPAGLWLVPLPFADDVRTVPEPLPAAARVAAAASDELVEKMRTMVQQLQLPRGRYVPARYPNPALQWHYRVLQAMALSDTVPEHPEDRTVPRYRQIHKRAGPYALDWTRQLDDDLRNAADRLGPAATTTTALPKRPASSAAVRDDGASPDKKKRVKTEAAGPSEDDLRAAWKQDRVSKFTVADLKAFAAAKGISAGGKKAELVEQIEAWFESK